MSQTTSLPAKSERETPPRSRRTDRHVVAGGVVCAAVVLLAALAFFSPSQPWHRLAQRWADSSSPLLYTYTYSAETLTEEGEPTTEQRVVAVYSDLFSYSGIDTVTAAGEFYKDIKSQGGTLERLPDEQQDVAALAANRRIRTVFLVLPWVLITALLAGYQLAYTFRKEG